MKARAGSAKNGGAGDGGSGIELGELSNRPSTHADMERERGSERARGPASEVRTSTRRAPTLSEEDFRAGWLAVSQVGVTANMRGQGREWGKGQEQEHPLACTFKQQLFVGGRVYDYLLLRLLLRLVCPLPPSQTPFAVPLPSPIRFISALFPPPHTQCSHLHSPAICPPSVCEV